MCVFLKPFRSAQPLSVYIPGDKSEKQHGCRSLRGEGGRLIIVIIVPAPVPPPPPLCLQLASMRHNYLLIPKAIISSCLVYILTSLLKEAWRTLCSRVSFLYCQKVSVGVQLIEIQLIYSTDVIFFWSLFEAI